MGQEHRRCKLESGGGGWGVVRVEYFRGGVEYSRGRGRGENTLKVGQVKMAASSHRLIFRVSIPLEKRNGNKKTSIIAWRPALVSMLSSATSAFWYAAGREWDGQVNCEGEG